MSIEDNPKLAIVDAHFHVLLNTEHLEHLRKWEPEKTEEIAEYEQAIELGRKHIQELIASMGDEKAQAALRSATFMKVSG